MIGTNEQSTMEIDQITSLVSIFSFMQQRAVSSSIFSSNPTLPSSVTSLESPILSTVASSCLSSSLNESAIQLISAKNDVIENNNHGEEDEIPKDHTSEQMPRRARRLGNKKKSATNENVEAGNGSDSESDTSSDSGHSSDDHDNSSEDKSSDTADDKSDEDISANESINDPNPDSSDILISQIGKRSLSSPSPTQAESFSCGGEKTKTCSSTANVRSDTCVQVASV